MHSVQEIRTVGNNVACVKPIECTVLTGEWRIYANSNVPVKYMRKAGGSAVRDSHYWDNILKLKTKWKAQIFFVLAKIVKCVLSLLPGNETMKGVHQQTRRH